MIGRTSPMKKLGIAGVLLEIHSAAAGLYAVQLQAN